MKAIILEAMPAAALQELDEFYRSTKLARLRTRAQMILLNVEQRLRATQIAPLVRESERTVQRWLHRYQAEGIQGLYDAPRSGKPGKVTQAYQDQLLASVRLRPRALGLDFSLWSLERLSDYLAEQTGIRISDEAVRLHLKAGGIVLSRPQHQISSPDPAYLVKKRRWKRKENTYADEFNVSWQPTLKAMWSPVGQQVMIPTPGQPTRHYGIGAVNYHSGQTVVLIQKRKKLRANSVAVRSVIS